MKHNVTFNNELLEAACAEMMTEAKAVLAKKPRVVALQYLTAMSEAQVLAAMKAAVQSISHSDLSYNTYQNAADAMMAVDSSNLKAAELAEMDMDDYWASLVEAEANDLDVKAVMSASTSKAVTPYVVAAAQMLVTLTSIKQIVKIKEHVLTETKNNEYAYFKHHKYSLVEDSLLASAVEKDPNNDHMMLSAEPFSDYDENGFNANNESIYL